MPVFRNLLKDINLDTIKGVLLDLDNTLYDYAPCHEYAIRMCYRHLSKKVRVTYGKYLKDYKLAQSVVKSQNVNQAASHSRFLYFQALLEKYFGKTPFKLTITLENIYWDSFLKKMTLGEGVSDFLKVLKGKGIKTCLVTNLTAKIQFRKVVRLGLDKYIDFIVSSEESGREKPNPGIFLKALEKIGLGASGMIMIGDGKKEDAASAKKTGITTYLIK